MSDQINLSCSKFISSCTVLIHQVHKFICYDIKTSCYVYIVTGFVQISICLVLQTIHYVVQMVCHVEKYFMLKSCQFHSTCCCCNIFIWCENFIVMITKLTTNQPQHEISNNARYMQQAKAQIRLHIRAV